MIQGEAREVELWRQQNNEEDNALVEVTKTSKLKTEMALTVSQKT